MGIFISYFLITLARKFYDMKKNLTQLPFYLVLGLFWLLGQLPLFVLYWITDALYYLNRYLIGYRRSVIIQNITRSFPELKYREVDKIADQFNRHFFGNFAEIIKYVGANISYMQKHVLLQNNDLILQEAMQNRNIFLVMGHYGNWESLNIIKSELSESTPFYAIYSELKNPIMDRLFYHLRSKFKGNLLEMRKAGTAILRQKNHGGVYLFIADQAPVGNNGRYVEFLHQPTKMLEGIEKLARACDGVVFYCEINRVKRGYYHIRFTKLNPDQNYTDSFAKELEKSIQHQPQYWLWSHRRWKRTVLPPSE